MKRLQTVHHADIAQALIRVMHTERLSGQIYNVADDAPLTIKEIFTLNGQEFPVSKEQNENDSFAWVIIRDLYTFAPHLRNMSKMDVVKPVQEPA